ncbi:glycosyltransferase family 2 protein [Indioceanicola profundi]|uniref:glycosyltransferase family 2 protein n=1 Tax=Indioceanicola profundi TaxID=2220096 RepID=UPI0013C3E9C6|nr:glycosyltransferase family 2 protein [Indioceanicola profundi]
MEVVVCTATYRRPEGLKRLLDGIAVQDLSGWTDVRLSVVVVDNNPDASAAPVVAEVAARCPYPLRHVHEQRRGISQARNRALDETRDADFICYIDDDEVPSPDWVARLLDAQRVSKADVVAGVVLPYFDGPVPDWARRGGFFEQRRHADLEAIDYAYTNNVLIRRPLVEELGLRFDEALGLTGGEDLCFFGQALDSGCRIVWADQAIVTEWIPASRISLRWLLKRWYRTGNADAILLQRRRPGLAGRSRGLAKGLVRVAAGGAAALASAGLAVVGRPHLAIARLYTVCRGLGMIGAVIGKPYREYENVHVV